MLYIPTRKIYLVDNNDDACAAPRSEAKICTSSVPRGPTPLCKIKCGRKETFERKGENYRVGQVVADLGSVDLDLGAPPS